MGGMMRRFNLVGIGVLLVAVCLPAIPARAASGFASPQFQAQWQQGEGITPNFWGPLSLAKDGQQEPYKEAQGGNRLVQYFDKGRMELTNGTVTNGLLATEIVKGQIQVGDATFQSSIPPAIPVAGDPDNPGPTYASLAGKGKGLFDAAPQQTGNYAQAVLSPSGDISVSNAGPSDPATFAAYDGPTKHNVPKTFADYRAKAGLQTIGYGISEPFTTTVKVGGQQKQVMVQVFERRVLTYTASNDPAFRVEMGNIGQHYYQWRYGTAPLQTAPTQPIPPIQPTQPPPSSAIQLSGTGQTATKPIALPAGVYVLTLTHNGRRNFIVNVFDSKGSSDLLVNEVGGFSGKKWLVGDATYTFDIQADGAWSIAFTPIGTQGSPSFSGSSFDVSGTFTPPSGPTAFAFTHTGKRNFIVELNCNGGTSTDLIQNEIGQVSGSRIVRFPSDATRCFWSVEADGSWTIKPL